VCAWHQIPLLARRHAITLVAHTARPPRPAALARLHALCAAVVFSGNLGYFPNVDGAVWFSCEVLPRLGAAVPETTPTLVGARHARVVRDLEALGSHIELLGTLPVDADQRQRLADAARTLVDTRYGWETPVAALDAIYEKIAGGSCGSSGS